MRRDALAALLAAMLCFGAGTLAAGCDTGTGGVYQPAGGHAPPTPQPTEPP
jgi:hypothetical protein